VTEDELADLLRQKWGLSKPKPKPPEYLLTVRLSALLQLIATVSEGFGTASGWALATEDDGQPLAAEIDRYKRTFHFQLSDLLPQ
jgi:hypothetical protein